MGHAFPRGNDIFAEGKNPDLREAMPRAAKIPKIMGVANKKPLCAFYAAVFCVDADFLKYGAIHKRLRNILGGKEGLKFQCCMKLEGRN